MVLRTLSNKERTRLLKKMRKLEKKYEKSNPDAILVRQRLEKSALTITKKLEG